MKIIISTFVLLLSFTNSGYSLAPDPNSLNKQKIDYLSMLPEEIKTEILSKITDPEECIQTIGCLHLVSKNLNTFVNKSPIQEMLKRMRKIQHEIMTKVENIRKKHSAPREFIKEISALCNKDQTFKKNLIKNKRMQFELAKEFIKAYDDPLHEAAKFGFAEVVNALMQLDNKGLLGRDTDVNQPDLYGYTPLLWATRNGHTEIVKVLLTHKKTDANKANTYGKTPLYLAACFGHTEMVKILLAHNKTDVNKADSNDQTPLYWATRNGHTEKVKALLAHKKIDVNKGDSEGLTPLFWAACNGHTETVKALLAHKKIDVNKGDSDGLTPLFWASFLGHTDIVELLKEK